MSDATTQPRSNTSAGTISGATIRAEEAAHFGRLAKDWWDPKGSSAMLHRLNPVRLQFLRDAIDLHWAGDIDARQPLAGKSALDVGCLKIGNHNGPTVADALLPMDQVGSLEVGEAKRNRWSP